MESKSIEIQNRLSSWFELHDKLLKLLKYKNLVGNLNDFKWIHVNLKLKQLNRIDENFFVSVRNSLQEMAKIEFTDVEIFTEVLRIIIEAMSMSLKVCYISYSRLAKIIMCQLRTNKTIVAECHIEQFVVILCEDFYITTLEYHKNLRDAFFKLLTIQLRFFSELMIMFPNEFCGSCFMLETLLKLKCFEKSKLVGDEVQSIIKEFKRILWLHQTSFQFYKNLLCKVTPSSINQQSQVLHEILMEIVEEIHLNDEKFLAAYSPNEEANFCWQIIRFMSENPEITFIHSTLHVKVQEILFNRKLKRNFEFIEKKLLEGLMVDNFWLSFTCFSIFIMFINNIKSEDLKEVYFKFFEKASNKSSSKMFEVKSLKEFYIKNIIKCLKPNYFQCSSPRRSFNYLPLNEAFSQFMKEQTAESCHKMIRSMKETCQLRKEIIETINNLIEISRECDWNLHSDLIIALIDRIIKTESTETKLKFLLKFNDSLNVVRSKSMIPIVIKLKLLDLIFDLMPLSKNHLGITKLLTKELNELVNDNENFIKRLTFEKIGSNFYLREVSEISKNLIYDEAFQPEMEHQEEFQILKDSKNLTIKSEKVEEKLKSVEGSHSRHSKQLENILKYSENINFQELSNSDRQMLQQIKNNFEKANENENLMKVNGHH
ncbi:CLUMA_CG014407, isoform A [Clunio marinus]|uniref:CLUMA_CG014407, isoform A n=1 Tax=Clunio marinus TaxID=568069 RepID=A0A1J1IMR1_9DIPT|nr:CLUMA_CG014407, isoform A [Clunio marinus]